MTIYIGGTPQIVADSLIESAALGLPISTATQNALDALDQSFGVAIQEAKDEASSNLSAGLNGVNSYIDNQVAILNQAISDQAASIGNDLDSQLDDITGIIDGEIASVSTFITDQVAAINASVDQEVSDLNVIIANNQSAANTSIANVQGIAEDARDSAELIRAALGNVVDDYLLNGTELSAITSRVGELVEKYEYQSAAIAKAAIENSITSSNLYDKLSINIKELADFKEEVTNAFISIDPDAGQISLEAVSVKLNDALTSLTEVGIQLDSLQETLELYATKTSVAGANASITDLGIRLDAAEGELELKADQLSLDDTVNTLNTTVIRMDAAENAIELKAESASLTAAEARISTAELDIQGLTASIALKASTQSVTDLDVRTTAAETNISALNNTITSKVTDTLFYDAIAPLHSETESYAIGDVVIYQAKMYKAEEAVSPGEFNVYQWELLGNIQGRFSTAETSLTSLADDYSQFKVDIESLDLSTEIPRIATIDSSLTTLTNAHNALATSTTTLETNTNDAVSAINTELASQASDIEASATDITTLQTSLGTTDATVATLSTALTTETDARVSQYNALDVRVSDNEASYDSLLDLTIDETSALFTKFETIDAGIATSNTNYQNLLSLNIDETSNLFVKFETIEASVETVGAKYDDIVTLNLDPASALLSKLNTLEADLTTADGSIQSLIELTVSPTSTIAQKFTEIEGNVAGNTAAYTNIVNLNIDENSLLATRLDVIEGKADDAEGLAQDIVALDLDAGSALISRFANIESDVSGNTSSIQNLETTTSTLTESSARSYQELQSSFNSVGVANIEQALAMYNISNEQVALDAKITLVEQTFTDSLNAESLRISTVESKLEDTENAINIAYSGINRAEQTSVSLENSLEATALVIEEVKASVAGNAATIQDVISLNIDPSSTLITRFETIEADYASFSATLTDWENVVLGDSGVTVQMINDAVADAATALSHSTAVLSLDTNVITGTALANKLDGLDNAVFDEFGNVISSNVLSTAQQLVSDEESARILAVQAAESLANNAQSTIDTHLSTYADDQAAQSTINTNLQNSLDVNESSVNIISNSVVNLTESVAQNITTLESNRVPAAIATMQQALDISGIKDANATLQAYVKEFEETVVTDKNATALRFDSVESSLADNEAGVNLLYGAVNNVSKSVTSLEDGLSVLSTNLVSTNAEIANVKSYAETLTTSQITHDDEGNISALASVIDSIEVSIGTEIGRIDAINEVVFDQDTGFEALWGIRQTVGDVTGSFGLVTNGSGSQMVFKVDGFTIYNSESDTASPIFTIQGTGPTAQVVMQNVVADSITTNAINGIAAADWVTEKTSTGVGIIGGEIGGWNISGSAIYSHNTTLDGNGFLTVNGLALHSDGWIASKQFAVDALGNAKFKGDITGSSGTFSGNVQVGGTTLTAANTLNSNTQWTEVNSRPTSVNELNASDGTKLAASQSADEVNNSSKTSGDVAGWNITTGKIYSGTYSGASVDAYYPANEDGITLHSDGSITSKNFVLKQNGDALFRGHIEADSGSVGGWDIDTDSISSHGKTRDVNGFLTVDGVALHSSGWLASKQFVVETDGTAKFKGNLSAPTGTIGGWNIDSGYIWTGTKKTTDGFSTSGTTLNLNGAIRSQNFRIDSDGSAYFKGDITGASGTFSGTVQVGGNTLNEEDFKNSNTTKADVGLSNVDNTSDATVLSNAASAANTANKTAGKVGGWTITSDRMYSGSVNNAANNTFQTSGMTLHSVGAITSKDFYINSSGSAVFKGSIAGGSININNNFTVNSSGQAEAKSITIRDSSDNVVLSTSGINLEAIKTSAGWSVLPASGADVTDYSDSRVANSEIDFTFINGVITNELIAARIYATSIEGDVIDANVYTIPETVVSYYLNYNIFNAKNVYSFDISPVHDFERMLVISPIEIDWDMGTHNANETNQVAYGTVRVDVNVKGTSLNIGSFSRNFYVDVNTRSSTTDMFYVVLPKHGEVDTLNEYPNEPIEVKISSYLKSPSSAGVRVLIDDAPQLIQVFKRGETFLT